MLAEISAGERSGEIAENDHGDHHPAGETESGLAQAHLAQDVEIARVQPDLTKAAIDQAQSTLDNAKAALVEEEIGDGAADGGAGPVGL